MHQPLEPDLRNRIKDIDRVYRVGAHALIHPAILTLDGGRSTKVAVKIFKWGSDDSRDEAFSRTLKELAPSWLRLHHPNVAHLYGLNDETGSNGIPALVSDYYDNSNIMKYLQRKYGVDVNNSARNQEALHLMSGVAQGLKYLHQLDPPFLHADIRGTNILVDDEGHARISDAGLLLALPHDEPNYLDPIRKSAGLCRWAAPELLPKMDPSEDPEPVTLSYTTATDVYAYGMTLIEVFSGVSPYSQLVTNAQGSRPMTYNDVQALTRVVKGIRPPLPPYLKENATLRSLVTRCWDASPSTRPDMSEVCRILDSLPPNDAQSRRDPSRVGIGRRLIDLFGNFVIWPFARLYKLLLQLLRLLRFTR